MRIGEGEAVWFFLLFLLELQSSFEKLCKIGLLKLVVFITVTSKCYTVNYIEKLNTC